MSEPTPQQTYLPADLAQIDHVAGAAAASNLYQLSQAGAFMQLLAGRDLGIPPTAALSGIYIVKGKPQISGTTLRSLIQRSALYDYRVTENTTDAATVEFYATTGDERELLGSVRFTMEDAKRAELLSNMTWKKYPRAMLLNRATSEGVRTFCPSVTLGAPVYVEGELDDPAPAPPSPKAPRQVEATRVQTQRAEPEPEPVNLHALADEVRAWSDQLPDDLREGVEARLATAADRPDAAAFLVALARNVEAKVLELADRPGEEPSKAQAELVL